MLEHCTVVLVRTMFGGNVGAAARAVKNTGMGALRLVAPSFEDENEAMMFAHGAEDVLQAAPRFSDLGEAVADGKRVIGFTARRRQRRGYSMLRDFTEAWVDEALETHPVPTHLVFGNEREGLRTDELDHCTELVWIPSSPEHPSYNLAQAVLLTGYEFLMARMRKDPSMPALKPRQTRAPRPDHLSCAKEQEELFAHLRGAFLEIGYAHPHTVDSLMRSYKEIFSRARLYRREAHMIRGLARQMLWSARKAKESSGANTKAPLSERETTGEE